MTTEAIVDHGRRLSLLANIYPIYISIYILPKQCLGYPYPYPYPYPFRLTEPHLVDTLSSPQLP